MTRCQPVTVSQGPFGIASCSLLEVGVFPTIVDSLATVEVMSVEVFWGFVVDKTSGYPPEVIQVPKHWPAALTYKS